MALTKEKKQEVMAEFARKPSDTGSPEVQIALLTNRIKYLVEHLDVHKKDFHTKKGLLDLISKRKKLLKYLKEKNFQSYKNVIEKLGLRK
ncbi:MAG TPA: 30S ribosomal protein S15 [Spirochaetota bacterium]|nr:30S ribosomal protein S15 [Spirochaetota bacterium]HOM38147.1 30S ribosomal protein S15 [Spirochaetota bacterium]HPQ48635.1 30S ribosomal protein S15 [Spirochaetota bacterium]